MTNTEELAKAQEALRDLIGATAFFATAHTATIAALEHQYSFDDYTFRQFAADLERLMMASRRAMNTLPDATAPPP